MIPWGVTLAEFIEKEIRAEGKEPWKYWLTRIHPFMISCQGTHEPFKLGGEEIFPKYHGYTKLAEGIYQHDKISYMYIIDDVEYSITF